MKERLMRVPLLDLGKQYLSIGDELRRAVLRVADSLHYIQGFEVEEFEKEIALYCGTRFAVGVSSGTDALIASLMALDIGSCDEVITSSYSFIASAMSIVRLGAKPVFVDIDLDSFGLNTSQIEPAISKRTKAILPVHLFGQSLNMEHVEKLSQQHSIPVVEDCAQAIGAKYNSKMAGAFGATGCFSFYPSKNLGCMGDGGLVTTNDEVLYEKLLNIRSHGESSRYYHECIGGNFRLDAIQAAVLRVKLPYLNSWNEARRNVSDFYRYFFKQYQLEEWILAPVEIPQCHHVYNQYVVLSKNRNALREHLTQRGIGTQIYYPVPLHLQDCFKSLGYGPGDFPMSERASAESLALPMFPELTAECIEFVVKEISNFYRTA